MRSICWCRPFLAHTFLAYFVGVDNLARWMQQSPVQNPGAFLVMLATTALMMFNFCYFREQTCIVACPYGRFQSVMLDPDSLIVSYDPRRGEPRGKGKHRERNGQKLGDCVDCGCAWIPARPASIFATVCNWSASPVRSASTPVTG
jgi:polyferredoxin